MAEPSAKFTIQSIDVYGKPRIRQESFDCLKKGRGKTTIQNIVLVFITFALFVTYPDSLMKLYLSSYKIGSESERLLQMMAGNRRTAYIPNAMDGYKDEPEIRASIEGDITELKAIGLEPELIDLKEFFHKTDDLRNRLQGFGGFWVRGGNTFTLRQAMKLSGLDVIIKELWLGYSDVVYGGYSAGICVLCPTLKGIHLADDPDARPYGEQLETIWEGLNMVPYCIAPHYKSDHFESPQIDNCIDYYINNKILFKALRDGEVLIYE
jgi:dipeptidase E